MLVASICYLCGLVCLVSCLLLGLGGWLTCGFGGEWFCGFCCEYCWGFGVLVGCLELVVAALIVLL